MFEIIDEMHDDFQGAYPTREKAIAELRRRAKVPWNQPPNIAPCTNWENCGRTYDLVEYDDITKPRKEVSRNRILEITAKGVRWATNEASGA